MFKYIGARGKYVQWFLGYIETRIRSAVAFAFVYLPVGKSRRLI
jgi:hypothetical protein